jgi:hypothetical protein
VNSKRYAGIGVGAALLGSAFVTGCTPPPPLTCQPIGVSAASSQGTSVLVRLKTAPWAKVLAVASFKQPRALVQSADRTGEAGLVFPTGQAPLGVPVKVTFLVKHGAQTGTCATTFIPRLSQPATQVELDSAGGISVKWSRDSVSVTGYHVTVLSNQQGELLSADYPAATTSTTAQYPGGLTIPCDPTSAPDQINTSVTAIASDGETATTNVPLPACPV